MTQADPAESLPALPQPSDFDLLRRRPRGELAGFVSEIVSYREGPACRYRQHEAASLVVPLIIGFGAPFGIAFGRGPTDDDAVASFASGLSSGHFVIDSHGRADCIQINFTPQGAFRFFGVPMRELVDRLVAPDLLLGQEFVRLRDRLGEEDDPGRRLDLAEAFVTARIAARPVASRAVDFAYASLLASGGGIRIAALAEKLGWSRKHLAERFGHEIGLPPKAVARIVRFNRALGLARGTGDGWAEIAAECGYADQAHLAREFRALSGMTPGVALGRIPERLDA